MVKDKSKNNRQVEADIEELPVLNVGIVGHIDHGKTTLLARLTGKYADEHSEELKRGITIKLGYADCIIRKDSKGFSTKEGEMIRFVTFVDAPGHEMLMATMLSGSAIMDAAILVIAANEGIMPQTREHLVALQVKNVKQIIIVQNKIDLVSKGEAKKNYLEIKKFIKDTIAENAPIIPCSAQQGVNINKILQALCDVEIPKRIKENKEGAIFFVVRSFDINRPGSSIPKLKGGVLGGALKKGKLGVGDEIEIKPGLTVKKANQTFYETITTKITSLHRGNYKLEKVGPGGSLAIETELDPILTKSDSLSGCVAGLKGRLPDIAYNVKIKFNLFEEILGMKQKKAVEPIKTPELLLLSVNTTTTVGTVKKIDAEKREIDLELKIPIVPFKGDNVGIARNINSHWRLIGWGEILG